MLTVKMLARRPQRYNLLGMQSYNIAEGPQERLVK